jgi:hypothetical protein
MFYTYVLFIVTAAMLVAWQSHPINFESEHPKNDPVPVWFKLSLWLQRKRFSNQLLKWV